MCIGVGSCSGGDVKVATPSVLYRTLERGMQWKLVETWTCVKKGESGRGQGRREDEEDWSLTPFIAFLTRAF